jgi:hypothetical protein
MAGCVIFLFLALFEIMYSLNDERNTSIYLCTIKQFYQWLWAAAIRIMLEQLDH